MAEKMKKRIIVGATGASGLPLLVKCLEIIRENPDFESYWQIMYVHREKLGQNRPVVLSKQRGC